MSRAPFLKLFFSDLAGDTLSLSDAEFGSYMLLLGAMWNAGGSLPKEPARLARIARCSPKVWGRRWAVLAPFFIEAEDGGVTNERLLAERQKVDAISAERAAAGKLGAKANALKNNNPGAANGPANEAQPNVRLSPTGAETPDAMAWKEAVLLLTTRGRMDQRKARAFFGKLLRDHRLEPHKLRPSILNADQHGTPDPQGYLSGAARRLGQGAASEAKARPDVSGWARDTWAVAVDRFRAEGASAWDCAVMGPPPGEPGCLAPADLLKAAA